MNLEGLGTKEIMRKNYEKSTLSFQGHTDVKADQVGNQVDNTGQNGKNIKKLYPIFDISRMYYYPRDHNHMVNKYSLR